MMSRKSSTKPDPCILHYKGDDFWKNYMVNWFGEDLIEKWYEYVEEDWIESRSNQVHLEVYDTGSPTAPTVVFSHRIARYARVMLPLVIPLRELGYNLVLPDLQGYGYTQGKKGVFDWNTHVSNLLDSLEYARHRFRGPLFLGGASMGGPIAYEAACRANSISGLITWCLWNLSDPTFLANETPMGKSLLRWTGLFRGLGRVFGRMKMKTQRVISYQHLSDLEEFYLLLMEDPQAGTDITLRGALSLGLETVPSIQYKDFLLPTLVVQPESDEMIPCKYVKQTFDVLGSDVKKYVGLPGAAHFPTVMEYYDTWSSAVDGFITNLVSEEV
jgi:alpha-beta hydrolase superfamily lysophospholipase